MALLGAFVFAFWLASAFVASAVGAFDDLGDALWSGVQHLLDPGSLGDDETTSQRVLGVVQVLLGIVLVVGLVLTLLTDVVDRLLRRLGESDPPARVSGHLLVIGSGEALGPVLSRLEQREPGADAVVLVAPGAPSARRELQAHLEAEFPQLSVRVVGGEATTRAGLERVSAARARAIAVLSEPVADDEAADARAIEVALNITATLGESALPHVGVEMRRGRNVDAVWERFPADVDAVVRDRALGAMLMLAIRNPPFVDMLGALSASDEQGDLFAIPAAGLAGKRFGELAASVAEGVPVGIAPGGDPTAIAYAPDPQTRIDDADAVIVAAESEWAARRLDSVSAGSGRAGAPATEPVSAGAVLIVGWSEAVASMLAWPAAAAASAPSVAVLDRSVPPPPAGGRVEWREGDPEDPAELAAALESVEPAVVLIASAHRPQGSEAGDAAAILSALHVCRALGERELPVLVEQLARPSSLASADRRIRVVSGSALAGETIALAALDPLALAAQEALVDHRLERRRVSDVPAGATFHDLYAALLEGGAVPFALARDGRAIDAGPTTPLRRGDEVLVVHRRAGR